MSGSGDNVLMECKVKYTLEEAGEAAVTAVEARVVLTGDSLNVLPTWGEALRYSVREIVSLSAVDHKIYVTFDCGDRLILYHVGYQYDELVRRLTRVRNELTIVDLLMQENVIRSGLTARCRRGGDDSKMMPCELRLYETALVVIGEESDIRRIPYSFISSVQDKDFAVTVDVEGEGKYVFSHFGDKFDLARRSLSDVLNNLAVNTQKLVQELVPGASGSAVRRAARLLRDGRAACKSDLEALCSDLWPALQQAMTAGELDKYRFLESIGQADQIHMGIKRGLLGDVTGGYMWLLIPIYSAEPGRPGNALVMETAGANGGRATYCFRLMDRKQYRDVADEETMHRITDDLIRSCNQCLLAINFRREPIYLSDDQLRQPRYRRYRPAVDKIAELRRLREQFIGRVIHYNPEQWQQDIMELLQFNVSTDDDQLKWRAKDADELSLEEEEQCNDDNCAR